ncbi:hypothetical protein, partial [Caulobacter sp. D5]|uniref:hypothetical protein n=1 Tax=Caulobacter sp. D5 TaxID=357400 RepID=UPI001E38F3AB
MCTTPSVQVAPPQVALVVEQDLRAAHLVLARIGPGQRRGGRGFAGQQPHALGVGHPQAPQGVLRQAGPAGDLDAGGRKARLAGRAAQHGVAQHQPLDPVAAEEDLPDLLLGHPDLGPELLPAAVMPAGQGVALAAAARDPDPALAVFGEARDLARGIGHAGVDQLAVAIDRDPAAATQAHPQRAGLRAQHLRDVQP